MLFIVAWQSKIINQAMTMLKISSEFQCLPQISGRNLLLPASAFTPLQKAISHICCRRPRNLPISDYFELRMREKAFMGNVLPTTMSLMYQLVAAVAEQHEGRFNS